MEVLILKNDELRDLVDKGVLLVEVVMSGQYPKELRHEALEQMRKNVQEVTHGSKVS